jgi:fermentation-respiration switch protein FrsA (DUF1100 family)
MALVCHAAVLLAAWRWSHSLGGFLLTGVGSALLLDRYFLRLLPWTGPVGWVKGFAVRAGYLAAGAAGVYFSRPGVIPIREALLLGACLSLAAFLLELFAGWTGRRLLALAAAACLIPLAALHLPHTVPKRTPAALNLPFEEVRLRATDGVELAGWLVPHARARGNVIFCHGHGRNRGHVAGLLPTLHGLGLNVLAFDFRGHGCSPGHAITFGHREVRDLLGAAAYLRRRCPGRPLFLIGVSFGAAVILQALPQLPEVAGVWSEGCFARFRSVVENKFRPVPAWLRGGVVSAYDALAWLDCGFRSVDICPIDGLVGSSVPIYFCHARGDRLVPFREGQALYDAYGGPKWHWWVADAGHYNVRQRHRGEYLRRLRDFVEECLRSGGSVSAGH